MKSFISAVAALLSFAAACYVQVGADRILSGADGDYNIYVGTASSQCAILSVGKEEYESGLYDRAGVTGISVNNVDGDYVKSEIDKLNARLVHTEIVGGVVVKYYYSTKIPAYKRVNGKKVNLQTAERSDNFTIGTPLIFGGY